MALDCGRELEMMGGLMSSVVLHAFALELALKALCVKRGQAYPKTHDLSKLFDLIPPDDRAAAAKGYEQRHPNSKVKGGLEAILKANAHAFEEWRYQHEYKPQIIVSEDLSIAFDLSCHPSGPGSARLSSKSR